MSARLQRDTGENRLRQLQSVPGEGNLNCPWVDPDLVKYLDQLYPSKLPPQGTDIRTIDHLIGRREVIDHLLEVIERQKEDNLSDVPIY